MLRSRFVSAVLPLLLFVKTSSKLLPPVMVTPDGGVAGSRSAVAGSSGNIVTFNVRNTTASAWSYTLTCTVGVPVSGCSAPASVTVGAGATVPVQATYSVGAVGLGTVTLRATNMEIPSQTDAGFFNVTVTGPPAPAVTPDGGSAQATEFVSSQQTFTVQNNHTASLTFNLACGRTDWVSACQVQTSVTVGGSSSSGVVVYFQNTGQGPGTLTMTATEQGSGVWNGGSYNITVVGVPSVAVDPNGGAVTRVANSGSYSEQYTVTNTGTVSDTYTLTCSSPFGITCGTVTPSSVNLPPQQTAWVSVGYSVGSSGGTLKLTATGQSSDYGRYYVTVVAGGKPVVALHNFNRDVHDRSLCLATGAGEAAAVQCGDLTVVHSMPAFKTMGRDRSLGMVYNSSTAAPTPGVAVWVTEPAGIPTPDSVYAELRVNNVIRASSWYHSWSGSNNVRQVVLAYDAYSDATGLYPFSLLIRNRYGSALHDTTLVDTLVVVNRAHSEFSSGWFLGGVETLVLGQPGSKILWVGGDGSARVYRSVGANTWIGPAAAFRDTLTWDGTNYVRKLQHGVTVKYNSAGKQYQTITQQGHTTQFNWGAPPGYPSLTRLLSITVPPSSAPQTYSLAYEGGNQYIDYIQDPAGRRIQPYVSTVTSHDYALTFIDDPDGIRTSFGYDNLARMTSRTNRNNYVTNFHYANGRHVTKVETPLVVPSMLATTSLSNWDEQGQCVGNCLFMARWAADTLTSYTQVDGPRTDLADIAKFWVDKWGAPIRILDPLGHETRIARGRAIFPDSVPAMVTRIQYADSQVIGAHYNSRGNLDWVADSTYEGTGTRHTVTTSYVYPTSGVERDEPSQIITPAGNTLVNYHATLGLPETITAPGGHQTTFGYMSGGSNNGLLWTITEVAVPVVDTTYWTKGSQSLVTTFEYSPLKNIQRVIRPKGDTTRYEYNDTYARVTDVYDPLGHRTQYTHDLLNRVRATTTFDPSQLTTTYRYTPTGQLDSVADPRSVPRSWYYDAGDRQGLMKGEASLEFEYRAFDEAGHLVSLATRAGNSIGNTYDADGRLTQTTFPSRDNVFPHLTQYNATIAGGTVSYTYDARDRSLTATKASDTMVVRTYNKEGTLKTERQVVGSSDVTMSYWYDDAGRRTKFFNGTDTLRYTYGTNGLLQTLTVDWAAGQGGWGSETFSFVWDALGRRDSVLYGNGTSIVYGYDKNGNQRLVCARHPASGVLADFLDQRIWYTRLNKDDAAIEIDREHGGNVSTSSPCVPGGTPVYLSEADTSAYDGRHQLTTAHRASSVSAYHYTFAYDSSGNRVSRYEGSTLKDSSFYSTRSNRPLFSSVGGPILELAHSHGADGSRNEDWRNGLGGRRAFFFNALGQLTGEKSSIWNGYEEVWSGSVDGCRYDGIGRRVAGCASTGLETAYDGDNVVRLGSAPTWRFVQGPGLDDPLVGAFRLNGSQYERYYYVTDGGGRQIAFTDVNGSDRTGYSLYTSGGNQSGAIEDSWGFSNGRAASAGAPDLAYYRNRYYDQKSARFLTEDPIGIAGGVNLYQYAENNPVANTDPFGLCPQCASVAIGAEVGTLVLPGAGTIIGAVIGGAIGVVAGIEIGKWLGNVLSSDADAKPTPGEVADAVRKAGASVTPHQTKTGEGVLIRFPDGTVTDVRVEEHPLPGSKGKKVKHSNVDTKDPEGKITKTHTLP